MNAAEEPNLRRPARDKNSKVALLEGERVRERRSSGSRSSRGSVPQSGLRLLPPHQAHVLSCVHTLQRHDVSPPSPRYRITQIQAEGERADFTNRARQVAESLFPRGIDSTPCAMSPATRRWTDWTTTRERFDLVETDVIGHNGPLGSAPGGTRSWYA